MILYLKINMFFSPDLSSGMKTIIWSITHAHLPRPQVCVQLSLVFSVVFFCHASILILRFLMLPRG